MLRASRIVGVLAVIVTLPTAGLALRAVAITAWQLFDPCVRWDANNSSIGPNAACRTVTGIGESRLRAIVMTALIPGVVLLSTVLAAIGLVRSRRWFIFVGALLMLAETPLVFTIAPLTAVTGLLYLILANSGVGHITQPLPPRRLSN
jgi:hypothetical protein